MQKKKSSVPKFVVIMISAKCPIGVTNFKLIHPAINSKSPCFMIHLAFFFQKRNGMAFTCQKNNRLETILGFGIQKWIFAIILSLDLFSTQGDVMSLIRVFVLLCTFLTIFSCAAGKISVLPSADWITHA